MDEPASARLRLQRINCPRSNSRTQTTFLKSLWNRLRPPKSSILVLVER